MILADKIIRLRKKMGWSQEELAERMNVSRQSVSKWEGAQSVPDLEKILGLGKLFGVTTDYLLKDEIEDEEFSDQVSDTCVKAVSIEEANAYLEERRRASFKIALATVLCILSPLTLIILGAMSDIGTFGVSESVAGAVGLAVLFAFIVCAVPLYIYCSFKNEQYQYLEKRDSFELGYGVRGMVNERKKQFRDTYVVSNIVATCVCIISVVPLIISGFGENEMLQVCMLALMILAISIAVFVFIFVGVRWGSMQKLLGEGEYSEEEKDSALSEIVGSVYWTLVGAIYLSWSFIGGAWEISWIVFVVGAMIFSPITHICEYIANKNKGNK